MITSHLTCPQQKALARFAAAAERGTPWFGAVDRRLKTMGLIEYVGNHAPHGMHRITEKGRQELGIGLDESASRSVNTEHPIVHFDLGGRGSVEGTVLHGNPNYAVVLQADGTEVNVLMNTVKRSWHV